MRCVVLNSEVKNVGVVLCSHFAFFMLAVSFQMLMIAKRVCF